MMAIQLWITASYSSSTFYILDNELRYYFCSKTRSLCQLCLCHCAAQLWLSCVQAFLCKTQLELRITLTETYAEPAAIKSPSQSFLADTDESCSRLSAFFRESDFQFHVGIRALSGTWQIARKNTWISNTFPDILLLTHFFSSGCLYLGN